MDYRVHGILQVRILDSTQLAKPSLAAPKKPNENGSTVLYMYGVKKYPQHIAKNIPFLEKVLRVAAWELL